MMKDVVMNSKYNWASVVGTVDIRYKIGRYLFTMNL